MQNKQTIIIICAFVFAAVALAVGYSLDEIMRILAPLLGLGA